MSFIPCIIASQKFRSKGQRRQFHVGLIPAGQVPPEQVEALLPTPEGELPQVRALLMVIQVTHCVDSLQEATDAVARLQKLPGVNQDDAYRVDRSFKRVSFEQVAWNMDIDITPRLPRHLSRRPYLADRHEHRVF